MYTMNELRRIQIAICWNHLYHVGIGTKAIRCPPQCLWMFDKYHRTTYSGRKITPRTPLHTVNGINVGWRHVSFVQVKWPRGHFKGSGRRYKHHIFQPKILYKVITTKDRVNGVCGIICKYIQETEKVSKFYNATCYGSQIRAFVRSKTNLPISGRLWTCYSIR